MLLLAGYFAYDNRVGIRNILFEKFGLFATPEQIEMRKNEELNRMYHEERQRLMKFAGQNNPEYGVKWDTTNSAWLIKGKLLDNQYAEIFNKIKDTIPLQFGDEFYFIPQTETPYGADARFVFSGKIDVDSLVIQHTNDKYELNKIYAKLVYEGKAEGYRMVPQKFASSKYIYPYIDFQHKYQSYFSNSLILRDSDIGIKELLLDEFFNTEEGEDFGYPKDRGDYRDYSVNRDFTQSGKKEIAIVLTDLKEAEFGRHKNMLVVVAYHPEKERYYMLYKKLFYNKIKIGAHFYFPEDDKYYRYADDDKGMVCCLRLEVPDEPERVLRYDKVFDQMDEIPMEEVLKKSF